MDYTTNVLDYCKFIPGPRQLPGTRYFGLELEINTRHNYAATLRDLADATSEWAIFKRDSSINCHIGAEMVTTPMTLKEHRLRWVPLQETLRKYWQGWGLNQYGVHIHVSRLGLSQLTIGKFLVFINAEATRKPITYLAGRSSDRWAQFYKKKVTDTRYTQPGRYEAVNLHPSHTLEIRIFQSTTRVERILMYLEFVDALLNHLAETPIDHCEDWGAFAKNTLPQRKRYPELVQYLTRLQDNLSRKEE